MSMIFVAMRLTPDQLAAVSGDDGLAAVDLLADAMEELAETDGTAGPRAVDLDKAWHAVHYLLNGSAERITGDAGAAVLGGDALGEDAGYGPARLMEPEQVRRTAVGLLALDLDEVARRYDPAVLQADSVYPGVWDEPDVLKEYVLPNMAALIRLYAEAAEHHEAVLLAVL